MKGLHNHYTISYTCHLFKSYVRNHETVKYEVKSNYNKILGFHKIMVQFKCIQQNWCVMKVRNQGGRSNSFVYIEEHSWLIVKPV